MPKHDPKRRLAELKGDFDVVDAASWESFPASDPPTWAIGQLYAEGFDVDSPEREATLVEVPEDQPGAGLRSDAERRERRK